MEPGVWWTAWARLPSKAEVLVPGEEKPNQANAMFGDHPLEVATCQNGLPFGHPLKQPVKEYPQAGRAHVACGKTSWTASGVCDTESEPNYLDSHDPVSGILESHGRVLK